MVWPKQCRYSRYLNRHEITMFWYWFSHWNGKFWLYRPVQYEINCLDLKLVANFNRVACLVVVVKYALFLSHFSLQMPCPCPISYADQNGGAKTKLLSSQNIHNNIIIIIVLSVRGKGCIRSIGQNTRLTCGQIYIVSNTLMYRTQVKS